MSDNGSGGMTAIVAIVAIVLILGVGYFVMQNFTNENEPNPIIDIELPEGATE